jgi:hypothetical protein
VKGPTLLPLRKYCCRKYADAADPPPHFHLYVIEFAGSDDKRTSPRAVYVGQISLTRQARFENHRRGVRAARRVRRRGLWLRWRLFDAWNPVETRPAALEAEAELAARLRASGRYRIYGGH